MKRLSSMLPLSLTVGLATLTLTTSFGYLESDIEFDMVTYLYGAPNRKMSATERTHYEICVKDQWAAEVVDKTSLFFSCARYVLKDVSLVLEQYYPDILPEGSESRRRLGNGNGGGSGNCNHVHACKRCENDEPSEDSGNRALLGDSGSSRALLRSLGTQEDIRRKLTMFDATLCDRLRNSGFDYFQSVYECETFKCMDATCTDKVDLTKYAEVLACDDEILDKLGWIYAPITTDHGGELTA